MEEKSWICTGCYYKSTLSPPKFHLIYAVTPLWKALRGIGIPQYLLQLIEDLHNGSTSSVRIGATLSPSFLTTSDVRQSCVLAPALFCHVIDWIMERVASRTGFSLGNDHLTDVDYADDVCPLCWQNGWPSWCPWRCLRQQRRNTAYIILAEDEDSESECGWIYTLPTNFRPLAGRSNWIYISGVCSVYLG